MASAPEETTHAIVGAGPAGVVLGLLLAMAGVDVTLVAAKTPQKPSRRCSAWSVGCRGCRPCPPTSSGWESDRNTRLPFAKR
jgi:glycine/D-amino acid oxidase-like deaminating enzyme